MSPLDSAGRAGTAPDRQRPLPLEGFLDQIDDAVVTLDHEWRFVYLNQAALKIYDRPGIELPGKVIWEVFPQAVGTSFYTTLHRVAADRQRRHFDEFDRLVNRHMEVDVYPVENGLVVMLRGRTREAAVLESEEALRSSEQRFRAIFCQAGVGIAQISLDGKLLLVNDRFCEMLGFTQAELYARGFLDITHPDDREASRSAVQLFLAGETPWHLLEKRYVRKDGESVWCRVHVSIVRDRDVPRYFIAVAEDVTDRVHAEHALLESQQSLAFAENAARLGAWDHDLRTHKTTTSGEYARLHGLAPDHPEFTWQDWLNTVHPGDRDRVRAALRESLDRTHTWEIEFRVVWQDGSVHWLLGKGTVDLDDSGQPLRMAGVSLDVTERRQAEDAARETEARFRTMADSAPVMIWVAGPDKVLTFFNKTWLEYVGRTLEQELGNGWVESVHPDDRNRCYTTYAAAFDARENFHIEYRLRRADGEYRWVLCSGVPHFTPDGEFAGYIGSDIDITDLKRTQEEAFERQKLESLGVLTSGIAHDFNNLLGSILVNAELAEEDVAAGTPPAEQIQRIKAVSIRAAEIVRELMIYSGQDKSELGPVDLTRLVDDMLELLKVSISKHAVFKNHLQPGLPAVRGNAAQLRQVVMNLIINASEAIGDNPGEIQVVTSLADAGANLPDRQCVQLEVSDSGCGMTEEQQARVFEPFFTTKFAGHGLGMAVVQGIVRAHNGVIQLASAPGRGTTVRILLPCAGEAVEPQPAAGLTSHRHGLSLAHRTVLLVEDEAMLRVSVSKILRHKGFSLIEAPDGTAAVDICRNYKAPIDVILLDLTIPGCSSSEVISEARRLRPATKVILTSAYGQEAVISSLDRLGASAFIRKPFSLSDLLEVLGSTLNAPS